LSLVVGLEPGRVEARCPCLGGAREAGRVKVLRGLEQLSARSRVGKRLRDPVLPVCASRTGDAREGLGVLSGELARGQGIARAGHLRERPRGRELTVRRALTGSGGPRSPPREGRVSPLTAP